MREKAFSLSGEIFLKPHFYIFQSSIPARVFYPSAAYRSSIIAVVVVVGVVEAAVTIKQKIYRSLNHKQEKF